MFLIPANTIHSTNAGAWLEQRGPTFTLLVEFIVFDGISYTFSTTMGLHIIYCTYTLHNILYIHRHLCCIGPVDETGTVTFLHPLTT